MKDKFEIGARVQIKLDEKFGDKAGWYNGSIVRVEPYSAHRSFYWVELDADAQALLGMKQISVFNIKNIKPKD